MSTFFDLEKHNSTVKREIIAGTTTFMTMAYILAVNPNILSSTGMDKGSVFTATVLASVIGMLVMAFVANLPFAMAPGMGLNAYFAYTVVQGMGYSWETALTAVLIEGIIFLILTGLNIREAIVNSIPVCLKHAISVGIGLFIAMIGLQNAGIIISDQNTLVTLGNLDNPAGWLALSGIVLIGVLLILRVKGAILLGIFIVTLIGIPLHITHLPQEGIASLPPSISPTFMQFDLESIFSADMLIVLFTFLFVDMFDTVGTLVGVSSKTDMLDAKGGVPRAKQALFADAIGTTVGALMGTSTVTTYVESAAGVAEGGRTGLTTLVVAVLFFLSLFFAPIFLMIPGAATAPALVIVGIFMFSPILKIDLDNYLDAIPAFLTIIMMPLTYSISEGIVFGVLSYVLIRLLSWKIKDLSPAIIILAVLFLLKLILS
jgi:AGZA family xanthine/uracil permease-like MFS transporter